MTIFLDDISLFKKIQTGNKESFDILFKKYYTPLCRYAVQFVKDNSIAEELVQDVFIYLWNQREEINISKSIINYLYASTRYRAYTHFRKETNRKENEKIFSERILAHEKILLFGRKQGKGVQNVLHGTKAIAARD